MGGTMDQYEAHDALPVQPGKTQYGSRSGPWWRTKSRAPSRATTALTRMPKSMLEELRSLPMRGEYTFGEAQEASAAVGSSSRRRCETCASSSSQASRTRRKPSTSERCPLSEA
jgi:hypothetical protein